MRFSKLLLAVVGCGLLAGTAKAGTVVEYWTTGAWSLGGNPINTDPTAAGWYVSGNGSGDARIQYTDSVRGTSYITFAGIGSKDDPINVSTPVYDQTFATFTPYSTEPARSADDFTGVDFTLTFHQIKPGASTGDITSEVTGTLSRKSVGGWLMTFDTTSLQLSDPTAPGASFVTYYLGRYGKGPQALVLDNTWKPHGFRGAITLTGGVDTSMGLRPADASGVPLPAAGYAGLALMAVLGLARCIRGRCASH
ncbi:MAG: hypothetical protein ACHRHE_15120 [Tepidisphaerales bacterium]